MVIRLVAYLGFFALSLVLIVLPTRFSPSKPCRVFMRVHPLVPLLFVFGCIGRFLFFVCVSLSLSMVPDLSEPMRRTNAAKGGCTPRVDTTTAHAFKMSRAQFAAVKKDHLGCACQSRNSSASSWTSWPGGRRALKTEHSTSSDPHSS